MGQTKEQLQRELEDEARQRFAGEAAGVMVLPRGVIRVLVSPLGPDGCERPLRAFEQGRRPEIEQFRDELRERFPAARKLELALASDQGAASRVRRMGVIIVPLGDVPGEPGRADGPAAGQLTPVMARLGGAELEIVDTLISAGIAANRAEAIRWALARIAERPAYAQLRERTLEIEKLKTEF
jgi:hypothetical protein